MADVKERTERGFRVFAQDEVVRVVESSLAYEGPHARVFGGRETGTGEGHVHLNVQAAKTVIQGLQEFVREAELGELTEPVEPIGEE